MKKTGMSFTKNVSVALLALPSLVGAADLKISEVPVQVRDGAEPNVMILFDSSWSMRNGVSKPNKEYSDYGSNPDSRNYQARQAATRVVDDAEGVRLCLARFGSYDKEGKYSTSEGGRILAACGTDKASLKKQIAEISASDYTPLSEAYYEVTRYFRGLKGRYSTQKYTSPIIHACQKNFTILVSDGGPYKDYIKGVSKANEPQLKLPQFDTYSIPDWDTTDNDDSGLDNEQDLYLDDLAKFGWDIDMSSDHTGKQNLHTYVIGFTVDHSMLEKAAANGHGRYYTAGDEDQLSKSLNEVLADISRKTFSHTALGTSSGSVSTGLNLFQARYNTNNWSGELSAFSVDTNRNSKDFGKVASKSSWEAGAKLADRKPGKRVIITNIGSGAIPFRWKKMSDEMRQAVFEDNKKIYRYIRGHDIEGFRARATPLGDIVNSSPVHVGAPVERYTSDPDYLAFRKAQANRQGVVYVGANDGMLHGFRVSDGKELLAYIPGQLLLKVHELADKPYQHRYYVDGSPSVADVVIGGKWRTVLVGGLNAGGQGIYALDITDPSRFSEAKADKIFLWEFGDNPKDNRGDKDMGYSFSRPAIVQMRDGKWYAVFGNGYNSTESDSYRPADSKGTYLSTTGEAVLFIVDLATGKLTRKISTGAGLAQAPTDVDTPNGLSTVTPVSLKGDGVIDLIYAGDLYGNIWRFDVRETTTDDWKLDYKLFQACAGTVCNATTLQPVTSRLAVTLDKSRKYPLVLFGTGKSFETADRTSLSLNSIYGLEDTGTAISGGRSGLLRQTIDHEITYSYKHGQGAAAKTATRRVRITSQNSKTAQQRGWYMDLKVPGAAANGERVLARPTVRGRRVIVPFFAYGQDPCEVGGSGGLMEIDKYSGSRLSFVAVDLNKDGKFDDQDKVAEPDATNTKVTTSSISTDSGNRPVIVDAGGSEFKYHSEHDGIILDKESVDPDESGRQSWRYFQYPDG